MLDRATGGATAFRQVKTLTHRHKNAAISYHPQNQPGRIPRFGAPAILPNKPN